MANQKELVGILNAQIIEYFNLSTNFVYIGEQNKEHIKNKHYEDYSKYYRCNYFRHFLSHRDEYCPLFTYEQVFAWFREKGLYGNIEAGSKYNSIYIFKVDGTNYVKVALRISNIGVLFARTLYKLNSSKFLYQLSKGDYLEIQK